MRSLVAALMVLAIGAAVVVVSGVISVKASSGHLAVTAWLLDLVKVRSVSARSMGTPVPPLDDPGLVRLGANHFERGCRPCHGTRWAGLPLVPSRMTPHPPVLVDRVGRWQSRELFYLVAHGVKFTGMPAWPAASRTDEAWAVVAFLRTLPGLDASRYAALTDAGADTGSAVAACVVCHRPDVPQAPRLSGQSAAYLSATLDAYAEGRRSSGVMQPVAAALAPSQRQAIVTVLASEETPTTTQAPPTAAIITRGDPGRDIPACGECHGPGPRRRDPRFPSLAGQSATYLRLQLQLFAEGRRGGTSYADIMRPIASRLTDAQAQAAAEAYAALAPPGAVIARGGLGTVP
jgi:cytochrome c553